MTKIMLVEDDKSLREIYGVRLLAEGYDIVSAGDGEEALAMAIKERPALIVADVMMPRISGFDMLDILRSTTETKNIKVIIMTALSSEDQRQHGEQLGADRYLVKSQVGIEDVVRVVHEVLGDAPVAAPSPSLTPSAPAAQATPPMPQPTATPASRQTAAAIPRGMQVDSIMRPTATVPTTPQQLAPKPTSMPPVNSTLPPAPSVRQRVIQPINDPSKKIDLNSLLDKELAREAGIDENNRPAVATTQQEKALIADQLQQTVPQQQVASAQQPQQTPVTPPTAPMQAPQQIPIAQMPTPQQYQQRPPIQAPQRPDAAPTQQPRPNVAPPTAPQ